DGLHSLVPGAADRSGDLGLRDEWEAAGDGDVAGIAGGPAGGMGVDGGGPRAGGGVEGDADCGHGFAPFLGSSGRIVSLAQGEVAWPNLLKSGEFKPMQSRHPVMRPASETRGLVNPADVLPARVNLYDMTRESVVVGIQQRDCVLPVNTDHF